MITHEIRIKNPNDRTYSSPFDGFNVKDLMRKQSQGKTLTRDEKNFVLLKAEQTRKQRLN